MDGESSFENNNLFFQTSYDLGVVLNEEMESRKKKSSYSMDREKKYIEVNANAMMNIYVFFPVSYFVCVCLLVVFSIFSVRPNKHCTSVNLLGIQNEMK